MKTEEVTHISQIQSEAFLRDVKGFNPVNDGECLITDFPVKAQSYARYPTHAVLFRDGQDFSDWVDKHLGTKTRAVGSTIFWDEISDESREKMARYYFFHHEDDLSCEKQLARIQKAI